MSFVLGRFTNWLPCEFTTLVKKQTGWLHFLQVDTTHTHIHVHTGAVSIPLTFSQTQDYNTTYTCTTPDVSVFGLLQLCCGAVKPNGKPSAHFYSHVLYQLRGAAHLLPYSFLPRNEDIRVGLTFSLPTPPLHIYTCLVRHDVGHSLHAVTISPARMHAIIDIGHL